MLAYYCKIALRVLWKNKVFSAINILGLSIGIATCITIILFVKYEYSYDRYNKNADRIVRVVFRGHVKGEQMKEANVFPPVAKTLLNDYPEIEDATRLSWAGSSVVTSGASTFKENAIAYADSNFFNVFTIPLLEGDIRTVLTEPNTMVITKALAKKYFGNSSPLGKTLELTSWNTAYKITGVIDKVPDNSHFHFDMFASMASLPDSRSVSWMTSNYYTYLVLPKEYDYKELEAKLPHAVEKYMGPQMKQAMGMSLSQFRSSGNDIGIYLQPLTDIHLHSDFTNDLEAGGDVRYIYIFSAIAVFMLVIACINFTNLSTARAVSRAKEVGLRKVTGADKRTLVTQFLLESTALTVFSLIIALILVQLTLPMFNELTGKNLMLQLSEIWLIFALLSLCLVTGVLAGTYPAFFLSSFNPVVVLKSKFIWNRGSMNLRNALVIFQFFISIILIVGTVVVYNQLSYIQNKKLGYNKEQILILPETWLLGQKENILREQLVQDPHVINVTTSGYIPAGPSYGNNFFVYEKSASDQVKALRYEVDDNYIPTLEMEMAVGRNFSKTFATDSSAIILNESAVKTLGWRDNILGKTLKHAGNDGKEKIYHVIGVVKDFHFKSMHMLISPLAMTLNNGSGPLLVKVKSKDIPGLLSSIKSLWSTLDPQAPFSYTFLDEQFSDTYKAEQNTGRMLALFAGLTIFIACLGLFGLVTYTIQKRNKEIGIRKVLGASVAEIISLLSKDFLKPVIIAFVISVPVASIIMNKWLQEFAYRISISWMVFALTATVILVITLLTVSIQASRAATSNPVKSLRAE